MIRIDRLESSRGHFRRETEKLRIENAELTQSLECSRRKEHESNLKVSALEKSLKNIAESQVIQKQAYENMERQVKQLSESSNTIMADNGRISLYLKDALKTIDSLNLNLKIEKEASDTLRSNRVEDTKYHTEQMEALTTKLNNKSILNWIFAAIAFGELAVLILR